jgi:nucleoside-diphosphate-sugar epimerase
VTSGAGRARSPERFLVTGAYGCIGAWTVRQLVAEGVDVVALDVSSDNHRLLLLLEDEDLAKVETVRTDITELDLLERTLDDHDITHVIHLAALQVPFCRADPSLGARVNVVGTVNVLEAVARRRDRMGPLVYASSIAAYEEIDGDHDARRPSPDGGVPGTLYGVYKRANEGAAAVSWRDRELPSIGLRPHTVYGPGRDQGVTSAPTVAMLAAVSGRRYRIPYGGRFLFQYAPDVARAFIAAVRTPASGAAVHNLGGPVVDMAEVIAAIEAETPNAAGLIDYVDAPLPFPDDVDTTSLSEVPDAVDGASLAAGVADSLKRFRRLLERGLVKPPDPMANTAGAEPLARAPARASETPGGSV